MKNYDGFNGSFGTTKIKIFVQSGEYKGSMIYEIGGNCKGMNALPHDGASILENVETAKFDGMSIIPFNNDWFARLNLTIENGDTLEYDAESETEFENMIVGMQIINFEEEDNETKIELKRCPLCGSTATVAEVKDYDGSMVWEVSCDACQNAIDWSFETEAEAIKAWNSLHK